MAFYNTRLVEIFRDTLDMCPDTPATEYINHDFDIVPKPGKCKTRIVDTDTLTACREGDIALNFASGWTPGGGVKAGTSAQEENLCQRSSLYRGLISDSAKGYYIDNHKAPNLSTNGMLLSHGVKVVKDAQFNPLDKPFNIDVLTIAAPRLTDGLPCSPERLNEVLESRIYAIVKTLAAKGYRTAVLGAWGCGVYRNDPVVISRLFHQALDDYAGYFDEITFAIPAGRNPHNLLVFEREFKD